MGALMQQRDNFVESILSEAHASIGKKGRWEKRYDYDALGTPFFKTTIKINKVGKDKFILGICAASVGDRPEIELAKAIQAPRVLSSATIEVILESSAKEPTYEIDFDDVTERLAKVLGDFNTTGEEAAKGFTKAARRHEPLTIYRDGNFLIEIEQGNVDSWPDKKDAISVEGPKVKGRCKKHYSAAGNYFWVPTFLIRVTYANEDAKYDPKNYQRLLDLAERIRSAFFTKTKALPSSSTETAIEKV